MDSTCRSTPILQHRERIGGVELTNIHAGEYQEGYQSVKEIRRDLCIKLYDRSLFSHEVVGTNDTTIGNAGLEIGATMKDINIKRGLATTIFEMEDIHAQASDLLSASRKPASEFETV